MSREDLQVGSAPVDEDCAQVGREGYQWRAWHECRALIGQLRRRLGSEPPGGRLYIRQNPHDFGPYLSVNYSYPADDAIAAAYADRLERELPATWDAESKAYLDLHPEAKAKPRKRTAKSKPAGAREGGAA